MQAMAGKTPPRGAECRERPASRVQQRELALQRVIEHDLADPVADLACALG
jgi:hypothetical protein